MMLPLLLSLGGRHIYVSTSAIVSNVPLGSPLCIEPRRQQSPDGFAIYASLELIVFVMAEGSQTLGRL